MVERWLERAAASVLACVAAIGCGRIGFDERGLDAAGDATDAAVRCTTWSAFGAPLELTAISNPSGDDWSPHISRDDLQLVFDRHNSVDFDVSMAVRASPSAAFAPATVIADVATAEDDQQGMLGESTGGIYLTRGNGGAPRFVQYDAIAPGRFGNPREHAALLGHQAFWVSDDELRVYWVGNRAVQRSTRVAATDQLGAAIQLVDLGPLPDGGASLALSADETELFVGAAIAGGRGGHDLYRLARADRDAAFGAFEPLDPLNTAFDEVVGSISHDGTTVYTNLDTDVNGSRDAQIWIATRTCLD